MLSFARDIAKAITADDTASLEDDPVTDDTVFTDCDIRIKVQSLPTFAWRPI